MSRQQLNLGTIANDGTGDTLRQASLKIEQNFTDLYTKFGDGFNLSQKMSFDSDGILFTQPGSSLYSISLVASAATTDRVLTLPDADGDFVLTNSAQTLNDKTMDEVLLIMPRIKDGNPYEYVILPSALSASVNVTLPALLTDDTFTFNNFAQTLVNKTLTAPVITSPRINDLIADNSGSTLIEFTPVSSAVNFLSVDNSIQLYPPKLSVDGTDTNIGLDIATKGTGAISFKNKVALGSQNMTAAGAVDLKVPLTFFNSAISMSVTMGNGTATGEEKKLMNINSGEVNVTPTSLKNYSTITMSNNDAVTLIWTGTQWMVTNNEGALLA